jgi:hypothetical protein
MAKNTLSDADAYMHLKYDTEKQRITAYRNLEGTITRLQNVSAALGRTPPKVDVAKEVLDQCLTELRDIRAALKVSVGPDHLPDQVLKKEKASG